VSVPTLYIFAGLPGSGKSTLAQELTKRVDGTYLRIDTIEQGLRDLCGIDVEGEGYRLAYRVAADNLRLGRDVVADSCNPIELTRREWERTATDVGARYVNIEVVCSDDDEHRRRVETRPAPVAGLALPTWENVVNREYHRWSVARIVVDTAGETPKRSVERLLDELRAAGV
jgi:predicted kinase